MFVVPLLVRRVDMRVKNLLVAAASLLLFFALSACGGGEPVDVSFDLSIVDDGLAGNVSTFVANQDDTITLNLTSDVHGEVHIHGYELKQEVGPDEPALIVFQADATGRYAMEMHSTGAATNEHNHDNAETSTCETDTTGMAIELTIEPGDHEGHYTASVEADNFEFSLATGSHWHLTSDGETIGMFYDSSAEVDLGMDTHEVIAQLNNLEHCALPVTDTVMVGERDAMTDDDDDVAMIDGNAMADDHDESGEEFSIGMIEIRPR